MSPEEYEGNLGINIVAKNFDTGFIKLDENIVKTTYNKKKESKKDDTEKKKALFRRSKTDVFEFEDQDIRTVSQRHKYGIALNEFADYRLIGGGG